MDKRTIKTVIKFLRIELESKGVSLKGIAMFGSQMRGTATPESDLDLILISDAFKNKDIFERSDITMDAEIKTLRKFHIPMDIIKLTNDEYQQGIKNMRYNAQLV